MCGIFAILNVDTIDSVIVDSFQKGKPRGPEFSKIDYVGIKCIFGFHRLAINGLQSNSNQPLKHPNQNIVLICNGEIYNYIELYIELGIIPQTESDCEIILYLYERYGIEQTLQMLDGVFSFVLLDNRNDENKIFVARDPYGVRPLYWSTTPSPSSSNGVATTSVASVSNASVGIVIASELKSIHALSGGTNIHPFPPGHYMKWILPNMAISSWIPDRTEPRPRPYTLPCSFSIPLFQHMDRYIEQIRDLFVQAVRKRVLATERPIACLLSGGLDSSLVTSIVSRELQSMRKPPLETYSIGLADSVDLKCARIVAEHLDTKHTEIVVSESDFFDAIPEVIRAIESYDTTTVRASVGNYLVAKYIRQHSEAKVIFNGDGSDELTGGYLYFHRAPDSIAFDAECRRLLKDIHMYDVLRSDRCISSHGLEPRTPFLDRGFVQYYLSIPPNIRFHGKEKSQPEKYLLRKAFDGKDHSGKWYLPPEILWRTKEAFSDGVSGHSRSWYEIIQEKLVPFTEELDGFCVDGVHLPPRTLEEKYYRKIFEEVYSGAGHVVPYFWMPRFVEGATDPSARSLSIYSDVKTEVAR